MLSVSMQPCVRRMHSLMLLLSGTEDSCKSSHGKSKARGQTLSTQTTWATSVGLKSTLSAIAWPQVRTLQEEPVA